MKFIATQVMQSDPAKRDLAKCDDMVAACFASEDYVEGRKAFMEKRKPNLKAVNMNMLFDALVAPLETRSDAVLIRPDDTQFTGEQLSRCRDKLPMSCGMRGSTWSPCCNAMQKSVEALALYLACLRVGSLFLPLNTAYMPAEMDYFVGDAEPTVVVSHQSGGSNGADMHKS